MWIQYHSTHKNSCLVNPITKKYHKNPKKKKIHKITDQFSKLSNIFSDYRDFSWVCCSPIWERIALVASIELMLKQRSHASSCNVIQMPMFSQRCLFVCLVLANALQNLSRAHSHSLASNATFYGMITYNQSLQWSIYTQMLWSLLCRYGHWITLSMHVHAHVHVYVHEHVHTVRLIYVFSMNNYRYIRKF